MKPTTYAKAEAAATEKATKDKVDVPIYRLYKSGKFTLDKPSGEHTLHQTIAAPVSGTSLISDAYDPENELAKSKYPEHDKLNKVRDKSQAIGEFLETGLPEGVVFAEWNERGDHLRPVRCNIQDWLADYFGIDRDKLDAEKEQMLDEIRAANKIQSGESK